ncbi:hypothetical protein FA95DRAFT_1468255, partial [Auriscalpium vulgare]
PSASVEAKWLVEARAFITGAINEPEWISCVTNWLALEQEVGDDKSHWLNVDMRVRPKEVHEWFKSGRKLEKPPHISNVKTFAIRWRAWWTSMQPTWRLPDERDGWPLLRAEHPDESWSGIRKAGKNGFVVILITLMWWTSAA